jgi:zinc/manganese transport system substrate-binding protein
MKVNLIHFITLLILGSQFSASAEAKLKLVTTTPNLAFAAKAIAGDEAEVESLLKGMEDPHFVDALPSFVLKAANADVLCFVGLELEVGWLPKVLSKSGNAKVQNGGKGFCDAGSTVEVLDKPAGAIDRSMGDVHSSGNPHYEISPRHLAQASKAITNALSETLPNKALLFESNRLKFVAEMKSLEAKTQEKLRRAFPSAENAQILEYHKEFTYFLSAYGIKSLGSIEETPGVPPSAGRIAEVALEAKNLGALLALASTHNPQKVLNRFAEVSGVPVVVVATSILLPVKPEAYAELQNNLAEQILTRAKKK